MTVGNKIKRLLKEHGMSQKTLTNLMGLTEGSGAISRWISGKSKPSPENCKKLGEVFNMPPSYFADENPVSNFPVPGKTARFADPSPQVFYASVEEKKNGFVSVIGSVYQKEFEFYPENDTEEYLPFVFSSQDNQKIFALKLETDEYSPSINKGEYVILSATSNLLVGKGLLVERKGVYSFNKVFRLQQNYKLHDISGKPSKNSDQPFKVSAQILGIFRRV